MKKHDETPKDYLLRRYPPFIESMESAYEQSFWDNCDFEKAQELSDKIIEIFKENNMTYTDAYAMLGFVQMDLKYRSERVKL